MANPTKPTQLATCALALVLALTSPTAFGQSADDVRDAVTVGSQIDQALRDIESQSAATDDDGTVITGEGGVFLLEKVDIFSVGVDTGIGYQDNPARTEVDSDGSLVASTAFLAGVATTLGNRFNVGANLNLNISEVEADDNLSNRSAVLSLYGSRRVLRDRVTVTVNGYFGSNMNSSFDSDSEFYGATVSASSIFPAGRNRIVRPVLSVARQLSDNDDQDNWSVSARVDGIWQIRPKWRTNASLSYTRRNYDDFFEDVTLTERKDRGWRANAGVSYLFTPMSDLSLTVGYSDQNSSFFLSSYQANDINLAFQFGMRF